MGRFDSIKKSRKKSKDIDEKIEYLNKELCKTGLDEMMTTTKIYQGTDKVDNPIHTSFNNATFNGLSLGHSGSDGAGSGGAYTGKMIPSEVGLTVGYHDSILNTPKAALSPPHPVSGKRRYATTRLGGMIGQQFFPTQPGVIQGNRTLPTGSVAWIWNPNINNSDSTTGNWYPLEFEPHNGLWGFWDTNFMGFPFLNLNLDQLEFTPGDNTGSSVASLFNSIGISNKGVVGTPKTTVLTQNRLDDPSFIPIDIGKLSPQGYNYLKGKSRRKKGGGGKTYSTRSSLQPVTTTTSTQTQQTSPSTQTQQTPPPSTLPSSDFDLDVELTPDNIPDEFKADNSEKPSAQGVTLTKWMSRTDFMKNYPDSSMEEYLSALPYGATNFMKPDPNFPGARILDTAAYERYFMNGDTSGVSGKPKHSTATPEPEQKKWGGKTKEQIIADLEADSAKYSAEERAAKEEMQRIALELGMDFVSLIGGLFTGGTTAAPVLGKLGMKLLKKYGKTVAGKMLRKLLKKFRNKKNNNQIDDIVDAIERGGNDPETPTRKPFGKDQGDSYTNLSKAGEKRYDNAFDKLNNQKGLGGADGDLARRLLDDLEAAAEVSDTAVNNVINKAKKSSIGYLFNSYKSDGKLLSEAAKLGHFEPEVLNVDIEKLRKGILPEFPKDPPPEMINGYSAKSKLAPKTIEGEPFLNITRKDLAKNHRFTDKEISEYMDEINAINDYIRKNPAELKYAMIRYPKDDPRLAQLNFKMDQMKAASDEYMETHFPENKSLFNKLQQKISNTIGQTDPKNFKDHTPPPQFTDESKINEQRKKIISKHFKKPVKIKKLFRG